MTSIIMIQPQLGILWAKHLHVWVSWFFKRVRAQRVKLTWIEIYLIFDQHGFVAGKVHKKPNFNHSTSCLNPTFVQCESCLKSILSRQYWNFFQSKQQVVINFGSTLKIFLVDFSYLTHCKWTYLIKRCKQEHLQLILHSNMDTDVMGNHSKISHNDPPCL